MKPSLFILLSGLIALLLAGLSYPISQSFPNLLFPPLIGAIGFSFLCTVGAYLITYPFLHKSFRQFMYAFLGGSLVKFFLGIIVVTIIAVLYKPQVIAFVVGYFFSYFIFTFFEVYALLRNLRPFSKAKDVSHDEQA